MAIPGEASGAADQPRPRTVHRKARYALAGRDVIRLSAHPNARVIIILRNQLRGLPETDARNVTRRRDAVVAAQAGVVSELRLVHAPSITPFHLINAVAATISIAEEKYLRADPSVQAVVPDRLIRLQPPAGRLPSDVRSHVPSARDVGFQQESPLHTGGRGDQAFRRRLARRSSACGPTQLEPKALSLTDTAGQTPGMPEAQTYVDGKGVTVAFIADGIDTRNPEFIRPDGQPVFSDYKDFSTDGLDAQTSGGEAFLDASSIAAQGRKTYALLGPGASCLRFKVLGMAPGASLMGLKAFPYYLFSAFVSQLVQAIQYAVDHRANVINESFGDNLLPDDADDPYSLANAAAVAAGDTVTVSSGDGGPYSIGSPATDPGVIAVGATTQYQLLRFLAPYPGYVSDNVWPLSSGGITQSGHTIDVVAPGDFSLAACTPSVMYGACGANPYEFSAGTSESAPLVAGEAALVIEAYRLHHNGRNPSPETVKQIIMSTATDLGMPSSDQGAGLIDSLKAVRAAMSWGKRAKVGESLAVSPSQLSAVGSPGGPHKFVLDVTNDGAQAQTVTARMRSLAPPFRQSSYAINFASGAPAVTQTITVPAGVDRLDISTAWDVVDYPNTRVDLTLFDPLGRVESDSGGWYPGIPTSTTGYGHLAVRDPMPGRWSAVLSTGSAGGYYSGIVHMDTALSRFHAFEGIGEQSELIRPGQTRRFAEVVRFPARSGDINADIVLSGRAKRRSADAGPSVVPLVLRTLVPTTARGGDFRGLLVGGNGRVTALYFQTYQFDVPRRVRDLGVSIALKDRDYDLEGLLVDPHGLPLDVQSTVTSIDARGQPAGYTNTIQVFHRKPEAGRWTFMLAIDGIVSGRETAEPFTGRIAFNSVRVVAPELKMIRSLRRPLVATIRIKNTGNTAENYFVDPRIHSTSRLLLGSQTVEVPLSQGPYQPPVPSFMVPPASSNLTISAVSSGPSEPISMDFGYGCGAPPWGEGGSETYQTSGDPDIEAVSGQDASTGQYGAAGAFSAPEVPPGEWQVFPSGAGPYGPGAMPGTSVQIQASVTTQAFDSRVSSSTGDLWESLLGRRGVYAPLVLQPGKTGVVTVTFQPGAAGTRDSGTLYVETMAQSSPGVYTTNSPDEVAALPYNVVTT